MTEQAPTESSSRFFDQIFPGFGIGLLMGLLVGITTSAVVSGLLTTLGGLLAAMLGLQGRSTTEGGEGSGGGPFSFLQVNSGRIGAFGLACAIGMLGGMTVRVKGLLNTPLNKQVGEWVEAGFDSSEARKFVAHANSTLRISASGEVSDAPLTELQKQKMGVLFNALSKVDLCKQIKVSQFGTVAEDGAPSIADKMGSLYHDLYVGDTLDPRNALYAKMRELADGWKSLPAETQVKIYQGVEEMVCVIQEIKETK
jgi:hypothetical protein